MAGSGLHLDPNTAASGTVTVDTELPAAAALADNVSNPTTPMIGAANMLWDGTQWERARAAVVASNEYGTTGIFPVALAVWDGATNRPLNAAAVGQAAASGFFTAGVANYLWNGASFDSERGNQEGTALASASRTATTSSADIVNYNARGIRVFIHCSVQPGGAVSNTVSIEEKSVISGTYTARLTSAAFAGTGEKASLTLYPGATVAANVAVSEPLPRTFRITVTAGNAEAATYSISYALIL